MSALAERVSDERLREMAAFCNGACGALHFDEVGTIAAELLALRRRVEALEAVKRAARESYSWMGDVLAEQEDFPILGSLSREGRRLTADLSVAFAALAALDAQGKEGGE